MIMLADPHDHEVAAAHVVSQSPLPLLDRVGVLVVVIAAAVVFWLRLEGRTC